MLHFRVEIRFQPITGNEEQTRLASAVMLAMHNTRPAMAASLQEQYAAVYTLGYSFLPVANGLLGLADLLEFIPMTSWRLALESIVSSTEGRVTGVVSLVSTGTAEVERMLTYRRGRFDSRHPDTERIAVVASLRSTSLRVSPDVSVNIVNNPPTPPGPANPFTKRRISFGGDKK